jgi:stage V sporulation protein G
MKLTEIRVKIMEDRRDKLQAFCSITIDNGFVIRDLKIIDGAKGAFVAMPSRKLTDRCPKCRAKNHLRAAYCNECGARLGGDRAGRDARGRAKLHADVAHPINPETREDLQKQILDAYKAEVERSKLPGYVPPRLFDDDDDYVEDFESFDHRDAAHAGNQPGAQGGSAKAPASSPAPR